HPRKVDGVADDGGQPAAHAVADVVARVPEYDDVRAAHADLADAAGAAGHGTGVPHGDDASSRHFRAHPVAGVALHDDLSAGHARAEVHAHGSVHHDPAPCHARADLFHLGQVAREVELTVGGAPDLEELAQVGALVAVDDGE